MLVLRPGGGAACPLRTAAAAAPFPGLPSLCTRHRAGAERINPTCFCLPPECVCGGFRSNPDTYIYIIFLWLDFISKVRRRLGGHTRPGPGQQPPGRCHLSASSEKFSQISAASRGS